ncbi:MAG TPA: glucose-6-phosphate isomerase, partial [Gemmataceae bacterium]
MQLPDESISYDYRGALAPRPLTWDPVTELQARHYLTPERLDALRPQLNEVRSQIAAERELKNPPEKLRPLDSGFIDLPQQLLDEHRRKTDASQLGKILRLAGRLREEVGRVIVLGIGGSYIGAKALFDALCHTYHNEMPPKTRLGKPSIYFEGNNVDNDALQDLLELLQNHCVDPELPEERWGLIVVSKSGGTLETAAAYRIFRSEAAQFYGSSPERWRKFVVPVTGAEGKLRDLCKAEGFPDEDVLTIPDNVGGRFSVLT